MNLCIRCITSDRKVVGKVTDWQRKRSAQVLRFAQDDILRMTFLRYVTDLLDTTLAAGSTLCITISRRFQSAAAKEAFRMHCWLHSRFPV